MWARIAQVGGLRRRIGEGLGRVFQGARGAIGKCGQGMAEEVASVVHGAKYNAGCLGKSICRQCAGLGAKRQSLINLKF